MKNGIWKYKERYSKDVNLYARFRIPHLDEGDTRIQQVDLGIDAKIFLKREDQNPTGSFKDRSSSILIPHYLSNGIHRFVISSSGNAAISAAGYIKNAREFMSLPLNPVTLDIFVSNKIPKDKKLRLEKYLDFNTKIKYSSRPKSDAIKFARENNALNIRGSKDDVAIEGYKSIVYELSEQIPNFDAIFVCCSSGTSTIGFYKALEELNLVNKVQLHIIQSTKIHPIASSLIDSRSFIETKESLLTAISDKVAHRKKDVLEAIRKTRGNAWIINDKQSLLGTTYLKNLGIDASPEMGAVVSAINNYSRDNSKKTIVAIMSGL